MTTVTTSYIPNTQVQANAVRYFQARVMDMRTRYDIRGQLLSVDRSYMREVDSTIEQYKAKLANKRGDPTKFQNVVIPVVLPQVEAAVTYQTSVFLQGYPIFGAVSDPSNQDAALQMDTIIGEQQVRGGWVQEYQKAFRNGFKYNLMGTEVDWQQEVTFSVENSQETSDAKLREVVWQGNRVKNLDLYNTVFDPSVLPAEISKYGEYAGYTELHTRTRLLQYLYSLPNYFNLDKALASNSMAPLGPDTAPGGYYFPMLNPSALISPDYLSGTDWMALVGLGSNVTERMAQYYRNKYTLNIFYARIIPSELGIKNVPGGNIPQVWKMIFVNGTVLVYMERQTNAHGLLPMLFAQPYDDGLGYQTKSLAANVAPIQEITTALANSSIASRRRAVSDRMLYDPSRVSASAINNDNPTSKIAVKPSAFGDDLAKAVYPIPFRDDIFQLNSADINQYMALGNHITGMNAARQGQFVKGNKTRTEYMDVMQNANGRDQTIAMSLEAALFTPTKEIIKANILQFQPGTEMYNAEVTRPVSIDPVTLRKAMVTFKISDGLLPGEKLMDGESLAVAFQTLQAVKGLQSAYNLAPMFSYLMKSRGARIQPFEKPPEQLAYEQAAMQWQQTIMQAAQTLASNKEITPEMMQEAMKQLPPQPTPEQFGWNPQQGTQQAPQQSVLQMVAQQSAGGPQGA